MTPKPFCEFRSVSIHRRERKERVRNTDTVHGHRHGFKVSPGALCGFAVYNLGLYLCVLGLNYEL